MFVRIVNTKKSGTPDNEFQVHYTLMSFEESSEIDNKNELINVPDEEAEKIVEKLEKSPSSFCNRFSMVMKTNRNLVMNVFSNSPIESIRLFTRDFLQMQAA